MGLIDIKKKINSTKNTRKITQALRLVAASKMKKFQRQAESSRRYTWSLLEGLKQSVGDMSEVDYAEERSEGATLFVLVTSDKGLCGALNNKLIRTLFRSESWTSLHGDKRALITIGRKATEAAKYEDCHHVASFEGIDENMTPLNALNMVTTILAEWDAENCREVILVSPHYVNAFTSHVTMKTYLPFSIEMVESHVKWQNPEVASEDVDGKRQKVTTGDPVNTIYEPNHTRVIEGLTQQLVQMLFIQAFYELKASEYSSRMVAMKKATEAADDMIDELTLRYNKARQAAITQSLSELAAAGEAMS